MIDRRRNSPGIYAIRFLGDSKKVYIGQAGKNMRLRWHEHKVLLRKGKHCCVHLQNAWAKHGEAMFLFEVIDDLPSDKALLVVREQFWMDWHKELGFDLYNHAPVAGSLLGMTWSAQRRANHKSTKGRKASLEECEANRHRNLGRKMSAETRAKMSASAQGRTKSPECRAKLAEAIRKLWENPDHKAKLVKIQATAEYRAKMSQAGRKNPGKRKEQEHAERRQSPPVASANTVCGYESPVAQTSAVARTRGSKC